MSLDKFLSGNKPKKKKKSSKSLLKETTQPENTQVEIFQPKDTVVPDVSDAKSSTRNISSPQEKEDQKIPENLHDKSIVSDNISDEIFVPELKNKSKNDLFEVILDIIHTSPTYSRNKNLLASYLADSDKEIIPELLADQLEISINEVLVLLAEIKKDLD